MLHSDSKQAEKAFCIPLFFLSFFFYLRAHSVLFLSQMNYGLNARASVVCTIYDGNIGEKKGSRERRRSMHERKRDFFFCYYSRKVETKRRHRREENKSGTSFHLLLLLVSVAHSIGHGHEHRTASNDCTNNYN